MKSVMYVLLLVLSLSFVLAEDANLTSKEMATTCLNDSLVIMNEVSLEYNISVIRFNDSYMKAQDLYNAQMIIETRRGKPNYDLVTSYCDQIGDLRLAAINALDSYDVFLGFYSETIDNSVNSSSVDIIVSQIETEIKEERYENVPRLIDQGYAEISRVKSEQTFAVLAYRTVSRGVVGFITENWIAILSIFALIFSFYFLYRTKISLWILRRKLDNLLLRKNTLKDLMSSTQKDYFQFGKIPEAIYRMRIKNFGELVRDIDRQIPLLQKEIAKYSFNKKEYEKLSETDRDKARLGKK